MLRPALSLTPETAALLARAMFPDSARIARTLETYQNDSARTDPARRIFTWEIGGQPLSAVGLLIDGRQAEILHIGTHPETVNKGYGRRLVSAVAAELRLSQLTAETDDDSVGFYRRCGFEIYAAPARSERRRFRCVLNLTPA
ncbi:GNAT family N-acetyltransferase [Deinococcus sp.]|uniref:GNAT family N-acetyltransferase n=1 Tax=Deinococcus sp. TaxID=47478 RepID=UPI003B5AEAEE